MKSLKDGLFQSKALDQKEKNSVSGGAILAAPTTVHTTTEVGTGQVSIDGISKDHNW